MEVLTEERLAREDAIDVAKAVLAEVSELRQWKDLASRQLAELQLQVHVDVHVLSSYGITLALTLTLTLQASHHKGVGGHAVTSNPAPDKALQVESKHIDET